MILVIFDIISFLCESDFPCGVISCIHFVSRTVEKATSMGIADVLIDAHNCADYKIQGIILFLMLSKRVHLNGSVWSFTC